MSASGLVGHCPSGLGVLGDHIVGCRQECVRVAGQLGFGGHAPTAAATLRDIAAWLDTQHHDILQRLETMSAEPLATPSWQLWTPSGLSGSQMWAFGGGSIAGLQALAQWAEPARPYAEALSGAALAADMPDWLVNVRHVARRGWRGAAPAAAQSASAMQTQGAKPIVKGGPLLTVFKKVAWFPGAVFDGFTVINPDSPNDERISAGLRVLGSVAMVVGGPATIAVGGGIVLVTTAYDYRHEIAGAGRWAGDRLSDAADRVGDAADHVAEAARGWIGKAAQTVDFLWDDEPDPVAQTGPAVRVDVEQAAAQAATDTSLGSKIGNLLFQTWGFEG